MTARRSSQTFVAEQLTRNGQAQAAVDACYEALAAGVHEPSVHCLLAELLLAADVYDEAIAAATEAIELDPDCVPAYLSLGLAYDRRGGMSDQALLVWHELAEVAPELVTAHVQLGEAYAAAGYDSEAIDAWRAGLARDPRHARAMYDLAVAALKREGMATALPGFRTAGELDPSQDDLFFDLLGVKRGATVPETLPDDRAGRLLAAAAMARAEDLFGAADVVRALLDESPDDAAALGLASYCYLRQEAANESLACALRSLAIQVTTPALYCLGVCFARRPGLNAHAARVFSALVKATPEHPIPHVLLGEALLGMQHYSRAKASFKRAVRFDSACVRARFGLVAVYLTEGRWAEAQWEQNRAAYHDTKRAELFWRLYDEYVEGGAS